MKDNSKFGTCLYIHYKGGVDGEEPTDDHSTGEPFKIVLGAGQVCPGIEDALCDMEVGEERNLVIPPEKGYYLRNEKDVQWYPKAMLPDGYNLHLHSQLFWTNPADKTRRLATVVEETQDQVKIDLNHPFAGRELHYWIKLVDLV